MPTLPQIQWYLSPQQNKSYSQGHLITSLDILQTLLFMHPMMVQMMLSLIIIKACLLPILVHLFSQHLPLLCSWLMPSMFHPWLRTLYLFLNFATQMMLLLHYFLYIFKWRIFAQRSFFFKDGVWIARICSAIHLFFTLNNDSIFIWHSNLSHSSHGLLYPFMASNTFSLSPTSLSNFYCTSCKIKQSHWLPFHKSIRLYLL